MAPVAPLLLAAALGWAALAKASRPGAWRAALPVYRIPAALTGPVALLVPLAEAGAAALLVLGGDATKAGAALSVALLAAFSLAVLRAQRLQGDRLPCGCFGGRDSRDYRLMLVRNAGLGLVAAVVLLVPDVDLDLSRPDVVPAVLAALGVTLIVWLSSALRSLRR